MLSKTFKDLKTVVKGVAIGKLNEVLNISIYFNIYMIEYCCILDYGFMNDVIKPNYIQEGGSHKRRFWVFKPW